MSTNKSTSTNWALILIAVALAGAGISYHFTLESRFASIEQKLDQNSIALQQYQISQETAFSSKTDALNNLNKEVDALQSSLEPLGKATHDQTESLSDIRKQIASLQQLQQAQMDAQKKFSDYAGQIEKIQHEVQVQAAQAPAPSASASTPASSSLPAPQASSANGQLPVTPRVGTAVDLRPAQTPAQPPVEEEDTAARAFPVALPVSHSATEER